MSRPISKAASLRSAPWAASVISLPRVVVGVSGCTDEALPDMYIAATCTSALDGSFAARRPKFALPLEQALAHAARDAAASVGDGATRGRLEPGLAADFAIVDVDPFTAGAESLLTARVTRTVVAGETVHDIDGL